ARSAVCDVREPVSVAIPRSRSRSIWIMRVGVRSRATRITFRPSTPMSNVGAFRPASRCATQNSMSRRSLSRSITIGWPLRRQADWNSRTRSAKARAAEKRLSRMYAWVPATRSTSSSIMSWGSKIFASTGPSRSAAFRWTSLTCCLAHSRASSKRSTSRSTSSGATIPPCMTGISQWSTYAGPTTIPGDAGMPSRTRLTLSSLLTERTLDERRQLIERVHRVLAGGADHDLAPVLRGQHHDAHDALAVDLQIALGHGDVRLEPAGELDELGRRAGVQAVAVPDPDGTLVSH